MSTRARRRTKLDYGRLREAISGPGVDPRTWIAYGRVDDDDDAISYEENIGWIVDVTFHGGPLDQEESVPCRVATAFARANASRLEPVSRDCEVVVLIPEGDPNASPTIIGQVHNAGGCEVPETVNGDDIDEAKALATHILVTPNSVDEQIAGSVRQVSEGDMRYETVGTHEVLGNLVELADEGAAQAFVKGNDQQAALDTFFTSLTLWATEVTAGITGVGGVAPPSQAAFLQGITDLKVDLQNALSDRIKGE